MRNDSLVLKHSTSSRERGSSNLPSSLHNKKILYEGCNLTLFKKIYSKSSDNLIIDSIKKIKKETEIKYDKEIIYNVFKFVKEKKQDFIEYCKVVRDD